MEARVVREPRTYGPDSPHSFFRDQALADYDPAASRRLETHFGEVRSHIEDDTREGRRAMREYQQRYRAEMPKASRSDIEREVRAATSTTIAGFTTPQWIISEFALFRGTQRTFADQCRRMPMPSVGLSVNVPTFTAAPSAGVQAEGGALTSVDASAVDVSENLQTIGGQAIVSQQLVDRTQRMPDGAAFDLIMYEAIRDSYEQSLNNYALGRVMQVAPHITGASAFTLTGFLTDLSSAREKLQDTNGVRLQPSHLFTTPDLYSFATRQTDNSGRPLITPQFFPGRPVFSEGEQTGGQPGWDQFSGTVIQGTLMWFLDATLPPAGGNTQFVVGRPDTVLLWEGEPVVRSYPQTVGNNLQVVAQMYNYAACIPRYSGGHAVVTGNGYSVGLV